MKKIILILILTAPLFASWNVISTERGQVGVINFENVTFHPAGEDFVFVGEKKAYPGSGVCVFKFQGYTFTIIDAAKKSPIMYSWWAEGRRFLVFIKR